MGPIGFEPTTSSLSGTRSNQLSYEPGASVTRVGEGVKFYGDTYACQLSLATFLPLSGATQWAMTSPAHRRVHMGVAWLAPLAS